MTKRMPLMTFTQELRQDNIKSEYSNSMKRIEAEKRFLQYLQHQMNRLFIPPTLQQITITENEYTHHQFTNCDMCFCGFDWGDYHKQFSFPIGDEKGDLCAICFDYIKDANEKENIEEDQ